MSAYVVVQLDFKPGPELDAYRQHAGAAIGKYGGRFLVRGRDKLLTEGRYVQEGEEVVVVASLPVHALGTTNFLKLHRVGESATYDSPQGG